MPHVGIPIEADRRLDKAPIPDADFWLQSSYLQKKSSHQFDEPLEDLSNSCRGLEYDEPTWTLRKKDRGTESLSNKQKRFSWNSDRPNDIDRMS